MSHWLDDWEKKQDEATETKTALLKGQQEKEILTNLKFEEALEGATQNAQ